MISLDQVQLLEKKVATIVARMNELQRQNEVLVAKNRQLEATLGAQNEQLKNENEKLFNDKQALMHRISSFENDQARIEQGILSALDRLNSMETSMNNASPMQTETHSQAVSQPASEQTIVASENAAPATENDSEIEPVSEETTEESAETTTEEKSAEKSDDEFEFGLDLNFDEEVDPNEKAKLDIF